MGGVSLLEAGPASNGAAGGGGGGGKSAGKKGKKKTKKPVSVLMRIYTMICVCSWKYM